MILREIQDFLRQRQRASLQEIAQEVAAEPNAVREMLATLERKQRVHRLQLQLGCGSTCTQCEASSMEIYAWGKPLKEGLDTISCPSR